MRTRGGAAACGCIEDAWRAHGGELRRFLLGRTGEAASADDLLQDVFVRAAGQGARFCGLDDPRAWLFRVARNRLVDDVRRRRSCEPVDEAMLPSNDHEPGADWQEPLHGLARCLQRNLARMRPAEREIIEACDLRRMTQCDYADANGLSIAAVKSRLLRARRKLRRLLVGRCRVRFDDDGRVSGHEAASAC